MCAYIRFVGVFSSVAFLNLDTEQYVSNPIDHGRRLYARSSQNQWFLEWFVKSAKYLLYQIVLEIC